MEHPVLRLTGIRDLIHGIRYARTLRQTEVLMRLRPDELRRFQEERLRQIVRCAYDNVELYKRKWRRAGVHPDDIATPGDLKRLPITTKGDLRQSFPDGIRSSRYRPDDCYTVGTSGSTGTPVRIHVSPEKALLDFALSVPRYMAGMPPVTIGAAVRDFFLRRDIAYMSIVVKEESAYESLYGRMFQTMRHTVVDSLEPPSVHIRLINAKRPRYLLSYPSTLRNICITAGERGIRMHRPRLIMTVGEVVDNHLRGLVKRVFDTELLDIYGSVELGFIACECPRHEGLHLFTWKVVIELLDEDGREVPPNRAGSVVVTDLFNEATPIIRYNGLGDYAVRKEGWCSCGRPLPLLTRVEGRMVDSLVLPNGQMVHPYHLTLALEDIPYLSKFQIRQERRDYVQVLLVKDRLREAQKVSFAEDGDLGRVILDRFNRILTSQVKVDLITLDDIPKQAGSHKYATVVSLVNGR
jgi:phenylacetate-CoA ligase